MFYPDFHGCLECFTSEFERFRPGFFRGQSIRPDENGEVVLKIIRGTPVTFSRVRLEETVMGIKVFVPRRVVRLGPVDSMTRMVLLFGMDGSVLEEDPAPTSVYLNTEKSKVSVAIEVKAAPCSSSIILYLINASEDGVRCYEQHICAMAYNFAQILHKPRGSRVAFSTLGP